MGSQEAKEAENTGDKASKEAEKAAKEKAKDKDKNADSKLVSGIINLSMVPPVDPIQLRKFEEDLKQVQELRLVLVGGSMDEGTEIIVSAENPIPLLDILSEIPAVAEVNWKGKINQVTLKSEEPLQSS